MKRTFFLFAVVVGMALLLLPFGRIVWSDEETVVGTSGGSGDEPQYQSIDDLPANIRNRIEEQYAARDRKRTDLDTKVENFVVVELTVPEAVTKLSNDYCVLCGIEVILWPPGTEGLMSVDLKRVSVSLQGATPRLILDKLVSLDPAFCWVEDRGIVNLVMRTAYQNSDYPLNVRIPKFRVKDRPYTMVFGSAYYPSLFNLPQVQDKLVFASSGRWPREFEPKVSVDLKQSTVREVINQVAREVGMSWSAIAAKQSNGKDVVWFHMIPKLDARMPNCCK